MAETAGARLQGQQPEIRARNLRDLTFDVLQQEQIDSLPIFSHEDVLASFGKEPFVFPLSDNSTYYVFVLDDRFPQADVEAIKRILDRDDSITPIPEGKLLPILEERPIEDAIDEGRFPILSIGIHNNQPYMSFFGDRNQPTPDREDLDNGITYVVAQKIEYEDGKEPIFVPQAAVRMTRRGQDQSTSPAKAAAGELVGATV